LRRWLASFRRETRIASSESAGWPLGGRCLVAEYAAGLGCCGGWLRDSECAGGRPRARVALATLLLAAATLAMTRHVHHRTMQRGAAWQSSRVAIELRAARCAAAS
jgi:hypothetical protein